MALSMEVLVVRAPVSEMVATALLSNISVCRNWTLFSVNVIISVYR